ncbi:MAG: zinc ribbon domain-containing protein [candidate division WS1 bacterium]|jgi:putative FmdB family regulatory protein|nr:zinc ribbon domain-containing protein [candidate division WS1 bacterium]
MPLYEFQCSKCGERFEKLLTGKNKDKGGECPKCGSEATERVPSGFAMGAAKAESSCPTCCPGGMCGPG